MTTQVKAQPTTFKPVQPIHRITLRQLPLCLLEEAYEQLKRGYSDYIVCITLGVSQNAMKGVLKPALEEALWERGRHVYAINNSPIFEY